MSPGTGPLRDWMAAVGEVVRAVNAAEPLAVVLDRVAEQACRLAGFDRSAVLLPDADGQRLHVGGWHGLTAPHVLDLTTGSVLLVHPPSPDQDTLAARAFRERRTMSVTDAGQDARYGATRRLARTEGLGAVLAAPLGPPPDAAAGPRPRRTG